MFLQEQNLPSPQNEAPSTHPTNPQHTSDRRTEIYIQRLNKPFHRQVSVISVVTAKHYVHTSRANDSHDPPR